MIKLLVGNKIDQPKVVPRHVADEWARSRGMLFMESSAKTKEGINMVFDEVVEKILENPSLLSNTRPQRSGDKVNIGLMARGGNASGSGCC